MVHISCWVLGDLLTAVRFRLVIVYCFYFQFISYVMLPSFLTQKTVCHKSFCRKHQNFLIQEHISTFESNFSTNNHEKVTCWETVLHCRSLLLWCFSSLPPWTSNIQKYTLLPSDKSMGKWKTWLHAKTDE